MRAQGDERGSHLYNMRGWMVIVVAMTQLPGRRGGRGGVGVVQGQVRMKRVFREIFEAVVMEARQLAG